MLCYHTLLCRGIRVAVAWHCWLLRCDTNVLQPKDGNGREQSSTASGRWCFSNTGYSYQTTHVKSAQAAVQLPQTWRDPEKALQFSEDSQRKGDAHNYHHFMSLPRLCTTTTKSEPMLEHAEHGLMYRHTHCLATLRILALQMSSESSRIVH